MKISKSGFMWLVGVLFTAFGIKAQSNLVSESYKVSGNCGMCKKTIEKAAAVKGVKKAEWNADNKELVLKYDKKVTSPETVLRQVAYAGYDNEKYLAPESAYNKLHGCCQYERNDHKSSAPVAGEDKGNEAGTAKQQTKDAGLNLVYDNYFTLKDALVSGNAGQAATAAEKLGAAIDNVSMDQLGKDHDLFMKVSKQLKPQVQKIGSEKNIEKQRMAFSELSRPMYDLMKAVKPGYEVYLDHCPMYKDGKGADWISKEKAIRNPFYGSKMLTCGNVKETLK